MGAQWFGSQALELTYTICERKKRAGEALSCNGLVQSWPEIPRLAHDADRPWTEQAGLF